ncbi:MAG TPA: molybdopterin-guanine dinucleotide biosynthesis protein MobB, partial [Burkholderiales bacterium]|nr:molybdopterin-guanine dinucleotide biosynthesis protein MobB [Burkholderiales bacterium]
EPTLQDLIQHISPCDLLLIEGFKHEPIPKLEVYRSVVGESTLHPQDTHIVAVASDNKLTTTLPQFELDDVKGIANFIVAHVGLQRSRQLS